MYLLAHIRSVETTATTRSLRDLRAWTDELAHTGIRVLGIGGASTSAGSKEGGAAPRHQDRQDEMGLLADLEGGSGGGAAGGAVPFLMVGTKEDIAEGVQRDGARLASELGMGHIVVVRAHTYVRLLGRCSL